MAKKKLEIEKLDELEVEPVKDQNPYPAVFNKGGLDVEPVDEDDDTTAKYTKLRSMMKKP